MTRASRIVLLPCALWIVGVFDVSSAEHDPAAVNILREANAALANIRSLAYDFDYVATGAQSGRFSGDIHLEKGASGGLRYRANLRVQRPTPALIGSPEEFSVAFDGARIWTWKPGVASLITGTIGGGSASLQQGAMAAVPPQLLRTEPLQVEIEQPNEISHFGVVRIGGDECDLLYLSFPPASGYGEQLLCFGTDDRLIRRIYVSVSTRSAQAAASFEVVFSNLRSGNALPPLSDGLDVPRNIPMVDVDRYRVGEPVPPWRLLDTNGNVLDPDTVKGKVVVLEFWATWCPNCRRNMPEVMDFIKDYAQEPVSVIGVNILEDGDPVAYLAANGWNLPTALDGDDVAASFGIKGTPAVVVIDPEGRLALRSVGVGPGRSESIRHAVDTALGRRDARKLQ